MILLFGFIYYEAVITFFYLTLVELLHGGCLPSMPYSRVTHRRIFHHNSQSSTPRYSVNTIDNKQNVRQSGSYKAPMQVTSNVYLCFFFGCSQRDESFYKLCFDLLRLRTGFHHTKGSLFVQGQQWKHPYNLHENT
jgi:hypothetical protein